MPLLSKKEFSKRLAEKIRRVRKSKGLSQEAAAYEAGLYRTYLGHIETSTYSSSAYTLYKVVKAFNVPISEIFPD